MDWIGWTCWGVIGLASLVVLWALFWDRSKGRIRCRRCAYDMEGVGLICPECGREHRSERALTKTRRKWKMGVAGFAVLLSSVYLLSIRDRIAEEGALGMMPTFGLALVADPQDCLEANESGNRVVGMAGTLHGRFVGTQTTTRTRRLWAARVARQYREAWANSNQIVQTYDLSIHAPLELHHRERWDKHYPRDDSGRWYKSYLNYRAEGLLGVLQEVSEPLSWHDNGGDVSVGILLSDQLIIAAPDGIHSQVSQRLEELHTNRWVHGDAIARFGVPEQKCIIVYEFPNLRNIDFRKLDEIIRALSESIEEHVQPRLWIPYGESEAQLFWSTDDEVELIIWTTTKHHCEIMGYLNSIDLDAMIHQVTGRR